MRASAETLQWLTAYYEALDNLRFDEAGEYLHPECANHYPTGVTLVGRDRIMERMRTNLGRLQRIRHELRDVWEEGDELIFEVAVTHWRTDGQVIERPGMGIFVLRDGEIAEQRLFVDSHGVWD